MSPPAPIPSLLLPLLRLGRASQALEYHRHGWALLAHKPVAQLLTEYADHLLFLGLTDNWPRGLEIVQKALPTALTTVSLSQRFDFYLGCQLLLDRLAEKALPESQNSLLPLRLPRAFPLFNTEGTYAAALLASWFGQQLRELAGLFDARNGNSFYQQRLDEVPALKQLAGPCLLPEKAAQE